MYRYKAIYDRLKHNEYAVYTVRMCKEEIDKCADEIAEILRKQNG
jgi:hypothetical protein